MQEKIEAVAPPPAKAPHTTLRPPKATGIFLMSSSVPYSERYNIIS